MTTKTEKDAAKAKAKAEKDAAKAKAKAEKDAAKANVGEAGEESASENGQVESDKEVESYDVLKGKNYIRSYSLLVHGEEFKTLADQFITKPEYSKRAYTLVPSSKVTSVKVLYREKEDFEKKFDDQNPDAPIVDKERAFTDKEAALAFNLQKKGSVLAVFAK